MSEQSVTPRQEDQFRDVLGALKRRKALVIGGLLVGLALGTVSVLLATPSYQSVARVLLTSYADGNFRSSTNPADRVSLTGAAPEIGAQIGLLQSPQITNAAIAQANVTLPPGDAGGTSLTVKQEGTTPVLSIEVNLPDADGAFRLAQAIPDAYNQYMDSTNKASASKSQASLEAKLKAARATLNAATAKYEGYLAAQGPLTVSAGGNEGPQRTARLNGYEGQLESAKVELEAARSQLRASLLAQSRIPAQINDTSARTAIERIQAQQRTIADLKAKLQVARTTYTDKNQEVKALLANLKEENAYLANMPKVNQTDAEVRNPERAGYDQRVAEARIRLAAAESSVTKLTGLVASERKGLNDYQKRVPRQRELEADVEENRTKVAALVQNLASFDVLTDTGKQAVQVVSISNANKTQPIVGRTLIASTILGLLFGIVAALVRDRFDNRVHTLEQIYDSSGVLPIGQVSVAGKPLALESGRNRGRVLESYRSLRFNLETSGAGTAVQSVLVASASAGEGRSALTWNLASEAATDMRKTILVDGDMRTPELHDRLKSPRGPGLSDVLSGSVALQDVLRETGQENLLFLPSGTEHPNPLELLSGPALESLHEAMKEIADVIIFNSPSLMRYTDGRALARVTDSVIFVAKRGFTRRDAMRYCVGMLRRAKARLLGVVLVDESGRTTDVPYFAAE